MTDRQAMIRQIKAHLHDVLVDAVFPELPNFGRGKVRDHYDLSGNRRLMITTDRQSAFDQVLAAVPFKGQVLTAAARFWFEETADIMPNHIIEYPDPNVMLAKKLSMLPVEVVVRDYLTGSTSTSIWSMYHVGNRKPYGIPLSDGMKKNDKLPQTIITPTTKGIMGEHDVPIRPDQIVEKGLLTQEQWDEIERSAMALFTRGREVAAQHGLILVDTKYEFGYDENGTLTIADEIHTPDSSRYWIAESYQERIAKGEEPESLDKEFLRLWIADRCDPYKESIPEIPDETLADFSARYIGLYERISGKDFEMPTGGMPVRERVRRNIQKYVE
ncbi:MAG: phosphoribosylaminoimidazolesuccinocarboxamide synthase [Proteobacteria bacterium]|jgi:phosphoribosylaminoimidazole-succinocarboxamide synthase|nr:phosphoribosylaminoimidazolesuccinocarboxamide synthase [Alphaproteobacteria bacterium]NCC02594.1 phosphoribosylaminoimidazolesuccinocarboxamide synthase [Pseudomonadota bacterium]